MNIRKESVRFVKAPDSATKIHGDGTGNKGNSFNIEFIFDADARCAITVYYFCSEESGQNGIRYDFPIVYILLDLTSLNLVLAIRQGTLP